AVNIPAKAEHFPQCGGNSVCPANSNCTVANQGNFCICSTGFTNEVDKTHVTYPKGFCTDINECARFYPCHPSTDCTNTIGSYYCSCSSGYIEKQINIRGKSQITCEARNPNSCYNNSDCPPNSLCNSNACYCDKGFENPKGGTYVRLDEKCAGLSTCVSITKSISSILNNSSWSEINSSSSSAIVNDLLQIVELVVLNLFTQNPTNQNFSTPELDVSMEVSQDNCTFLHIDIGSSRMNVSCNLLPGSEDGAIFIVYKSLDDKLHENFLRLSEEDEENYDIVVNSRVVTGAITSNTTKDLNPPVTFSLNHLQVPDSDMISLCVFWDPKLKGWSERGCNVKDSNVTHTVCSCDHLSTFAVIMAPCQIKEDDGLLHGLLYISRVGLSLSIICLFLSLLTFLLCRSLRSAHTSMLIALSGCLFLAQLIILFGLHQTRNMTLCSIIAGCLHYILLCSFGWMSLESVLLFLTVRNLRAMNFLTSRRSHFPSACLIGFGVPAVIVAISASVSPHGYGTNKWCWLNGNLIWSFLGPVCVLITINTILLISTFYLLRVKLAALNTNVSTLKDTRLLTFKALTQLFILGSTWILGFFQCGPGAMVASYLFTICNSLQGVFIFLVHCLLNRQVREEYHKASRRLYAAKSDSEPVSGSTAPVTMKLVTFGLISSLFTPLLHQH
ncbi:hypothetical protein GDO86_006857, partial [Hymenochirus boettgeri]